MAKKIIKVVDAYYPIGLGYRELQRIIGSSYNRIYDFCVSQLREYGILTSSQNKKTRLCLSKNARLKHILGIPVIPNNISDILREQNRHVRRNQRKSKNIIKKEETKEDNVLKMYQLLLLFDIVEDEILEIPLSKLEKILSTIGISSNDLEIGYVERKDADRVITTIYKPVSCILIWKQEIHQSQTTKLKRHSLNTVDVEEGDNFNTNAFSNNNDEKPYWMNVNDAIIKKSSPLAGPDNRNDTFIIYYMKILGVSVGDILYRSRSLFTHIQFSTNELQNAFDHLEGDLKAIEPIGILDDEKRYKVVESLRGLINDYWNIDIWLSQKMNKSLMYARKPKPQEKEFLVKRFGYNQVEDIIRKNYEDPSLNRRNINPTDSERIAFAKRDEEVFNNIARNYYDNIKEKQNNMIEEHRFVIDELIKDLTKHDLLINKPKKRRKMEEKMGRKRLAKIRRTKIDNYAKSI